MVCMINHGPDCRRTFLAFVSAMSFIKLKRGLKLESEWWYAVSKNGLQCTRYSQNTLELDMTHWNNVECSIYFCLSGWTACILLLIALIFSKSLITLTTNAIFSTILHMTWSIIILWIVIASISKHRGAIRFWNDFWTILFWNWKINTWFDWCMLLLLLF